MFDVFYNSLSNKEKDEFCKNAKTTRGTVRNAYMPKDPLKRRAARPEAIVSMIMASNGKLNTLLMLDYFYGAIIQELLIQNGYDFGRKDGKRNISIIETLPE